MYKIENIINKVHCADCLVFMRKMPSNCIDAVVCDPPYGLTDNKSGFHRGKNSPFKRTAKGGFMGKKWDGSGIEQNVDMWKQCLRVLKPGGYLLSFAGTRTYHRIACAIEDAGFEIRDMIAWIYGSGFPKSLNIGKAVDKLQGNKREDLGENDNQRLNKPQVDVYEAGIRGKEARLTKGISKWEGWGTALKPALEPICVARKPLSEKTVAKNVLKWGTGGINIDGSRVGTTEKITNHSRGQKSAKSKGKYGDSSAQKTHQTEGQTQGRFPANLIHDGSDEVVRGFPNSKSGAMKKPYKYTNTGFSLGKPTGKTKQIHGASEGSASRFFYCAKASKSERNMGCEGLPLGEPPASARSKPAEGRENPLGKPRANNHPTVKPLALMEYLVKLVTRPGGTVLDPFMGSGTTGMACAKLKMDFIGIEKEKDYFKIAKRRIASVPIPMF